MQPSSVATRRGRLILSGAGHEWPAYRHTVANATPHPNDTWTMGREFHKGGCVFPPFEYLRYSAGVFSLLRHPTLSVPAHVLAPPNSATAPPDCVRSDRAVAG